MFGVHVDGWTYRVIPANTPNEVTFTHFTGNDQWYVPFPGLLQTSPVNATSWENVFNPPSP